MKLSLLAALDLLSRSVRVLADGCQAKAEEFWSVPKVGRGQVALAGGGDVRELVLATGLVDAGLLAHLLHPEGPDGIAVTPR